MAAPVALIPPFNTPLFKILPNSDNTFTSATDNGIKTFAIKDWEKYTGQKFIGFSTSKS